MPFSQQMAWTRGLRRLQGKLGMLINTLRYCLAEIPQYGYCFQRNTLIFLWLFFFGINAVAQDIRFEHYTSEDGLPSNGLYAVAESKAGHLWIGSKAGLTRYDGLTFQSLLHHRDDEFALPGRSVQFLLNDSKDRLWVSLEGSGLAQVDDNLHIVQHMSTISGTPLLPDDNVWSMTEGCDGNIWLGFAGSGVARFNPETSSIETIPINIPDAQTDARLVTSLHIDQHCKVWAGLLNRGLFYLDDSQQQFIAVKAENWEISTKSIRSIIDHEDKIYAVLNNEIGVFNSRNAEYLEKIDIKEPAGIDNVNLQSISVYEDSLWVASSTGLYTIDLKNQRQYNSTDNLDQLLTRGTFVGDYYVRRYQSQETVPGSLPSDNLFFIIRNTDGNAWIATQDNGLIYKPPGWDNFNVLRRNPLADNQLPSNNIIATHVNDQHLWLGTDDGGLARYAYQTDMLDTPESLKSIPFRRVWSIHTDQNKDVWIAGVQRFLRYTPGEGFIEPALPPEILAALRGIRPLGTVELGDTLWYIAKHRYILGYGLSSDQWILRPVAPGSGPFTFNDYAKVNEQQLLLAAETRLFSYNSSDDSFEVILDVGENHIQQIEFDQNNHLWVAQKNGMTQYHFDGQSLTKKIQLRYPAELRTTVINNMRFDPQNQIWLGSLNGLFKLIPTLSSLNDNDQLAFLHITRSDSLPSSEMSEQTMVQLGDRQLAIGTKQGLINFDPQEIVPIEHKLSIEITSLSSLEHDLTRDQLNKQSLTFEHNDNTLSIRFNALTFNNRDKLNYQYRLDNWDEDWITTAQAPQITYSRLKHGDYTFQTRARIGIDDWSAINNSLRFSIRRPPWIRWWAYVSYGMMLLLISWLLRQRNIQSRMRRKTLHRAHARQQFAETQTRIATDFARAIHYEEIAATLSNTLHQAIPLSRIVVDFRDEKYPPHEFIYANQAAPNVNAKVDFPYLYDGFEKKPDMRFHQQEMERDGQSTSILLSLPLGAKRPVQAITSLHFPVDHVPTENEIALASLVAQTAETAVHNTVLLEQVSQLASLNQRANEAKSEFISTVSHEIRTPLHGLMGMLDLLNNRPLQEQRQQILQRLTDSSQQLLSVVDDVLDISKIEANKLELNSETFELSSVLAHIVQLFHDQANSKNLYLHGLTTPGTCRWWLGDRARLVQILTNLVNNAIKFTATGGVLLCARETVYNSIPGVQLMVADSGPGMSNDVMNRLFDEYQQADDWTWKKYGGSGLGLSITKRLTDLMKGNISVTSQIDHGTQFHVFLPLEKPSILNSIAILHWPKNLIIHLVCGNSNTVFELLFNQPGQIRSQTLDMLELPHAIAGKCNILLTTSEKLAKNSAMSTALIHWGDDQLTSVESNSIRSFKLAQDWPKLIAWLMSRTD